MQTTRAAVLRILLALPMLTLACASPRTPAAPASPAAAAQEAHAQPEMTPVGDNADASGADPAVTDPDKYQVVLENEDVRVLRYHDLPGAKTNQHRHPKAVLYALSDFRRQLTFPDGTTKQRDFHAGDVMWIPAQTHVGENIGDTDTEVLMVELKAP